MKRMHTEKEIRSLADSEIDQRHLYQHLTNVTISKGEEVAHLIVLSLLPSADVITSDTFLAKVQSHHIANGTSNYDEGYAVASFYADDEDIEITLLNISSNEYVTETLSVATTTVTVVIDNVTQLY